MANKETQLSIVLRTVDRATAKINAINKRLDAVTKPIRDFKKALGDLREKSGLDDVIGGFRGVGSALSDVLGKVALVGGVVAAAVSGLFKLVDGFDELGDKAEAIGVSVDFLAQMRYAAERSGASVEQLDAGLQAFSKSLGQARAGTGRMAGFLEKVSPALLRQLKAAKSNEAAFDLLAGAMAKLEDPAKRAALAQATVGDAELGPLFKKGPKGIKELRDRYLELAGSQQGAADQAGEVDDSLKDLKASTDGIKAALVEGLSPALKQLVEELRAFFSENRERIAEWSKDLGKTLPGAIHDFVDGFLNAIDSVQEFIESIGGLKTVAIALAAVIVGPLISAFVSLGIAIASTPVGWILAAIAALAVAWYVVITRWDEVKAYFGRFWDWLGEKIGPFRHVLKLVLLPFIGGAGILMSAWGPIKDFFSGLWDGIVSVFNKAWDFIKGIVDKIVGAVKTVTGAIESVTDFVTGRTTLEKSLAGTGLLEQADLSAQSAAALDSRTLTEAKITLEIANAPPGTRVRTDPQSTASVDMSVGYNMLPGGS